MKDTILDFGQHRRNRYWDNRFKHFAVKLLPGECYIAQQREMIVTVLGSCISACIRDRRLKIGGMNHFMLPGDYRHGLKNKSIAEEYKYAEARYGTVAMESLINGIIGQGGRREYLEAKLFGGARVTSALTDIGSTNINFVHEYLAIEKIPIVNEDVGGFLPRKIYYAPAIGDVFVKKIQKINNDTIVKRELGYSKDLKQSDIEGDVTFFD